MADARKEFPFIKDFYLSFFIYFIYGIFSYRSQLRSQQAIEKDYVEIACELWLQPRTPSFTYAGNTQRNEKIR